jgi:hypothetical protein
MKNIRYSDTEGTSDNINPKYYLSKTFHNLLPNISFNNTSTKEIEEIINSIRVKNSHVYDGITTKMIKASAPYIRSPLNYISNKSIRSGTSPIHLEYSIVKPLFKKGDRGNMANYRPISLLPQFLKYSEKSYMKDFCNILKLITF